MEQNHLASYIDHTLLKPEATESQVRKLCQEAVQNQFASVCINPAWVSFCGSELQGSLVKVCTVIGFPLGASVTKVKVYEAQQAMQDGATEIDMVLNIGAVKSGQDDLVQEDIYRVVQSAQKKASVKVIIETSLLTEAEKVRACLLSQAGGADFVKTSTGFAAGGATQDDVRLMRQTVGPDMGLKASGGIRDQKTALAMIEAGATRLGTSNSLAIVQGITSA